MWDVTDEDFEVIDKGFPNTISNPLRDRGNITILDGNLSPDGCVAKITGKEGDYFKGPAIVFENHKELIDADIVDAYIIATPNFTHIEVLRDLRY